jgi:alanine dehydrogenase
MSTSKTTDLLLLDSHQVEALLELGPVLDAVKQAFALHSRREGRVFPLVRERLHTGGVFGIKSGDIAAQNVLGFKAAGFWPGNRALASEQHQATILLIDPATGRPLCLIDGNAVTTMRTGAAGGMGLQLLARPDSRKLCLFGTGVQGRIQLDYALLLLPQLQQVRYATSNGEANPAFEALYRSRCDLVHARDVNAAVADSDVVITATTGGGALFDLAAVQPGTHISCIGSDTRGKRELPEGLLPRARLFVDDQTQASTLGELQWAPATACTEIGDLLTGQAQLTRQPGEITVFDSTGIALQDLTVAQQLFERATATQAGTRIDWPW